MANTFDDGFVKSIMDKTDKEFTAFCRELGFSDAQIRDINALADENLAEHMSGYDLSTTCGYWLSSFDLNKQPR